MIKRIDPQNLDSTVSRAEREYLEQLVQEQEDPATRHSTYLRCRFDGKYELTEWFEPTAQETLCALSELAPVFLKLQRFPSCTCAEEYAHLSSAKRVLEAATNSFQFTSQSLRQLQEKKKIPRPLMKKMKTLEDQIFYTQQDVANVLMTTVLTQQQVAQYGDEIMACVKDTGINEDHRRARLHEMQTALDRFYGQVPVKPFPPTNEPCPFCHLPHRYSWVELLPFELPAIQRAIDTLVGAPVMLQDVPKVIQNLERWIFAAEVDSFTTLDDTKKNTPTITGMLMQQFKTVTQETRSTLLQQFGWNAANTPNTASSVSISSTTPPPPVPNDIPDAS